MSKEMNMCLFFSFIALNHSMTAAELLHLLTRGLDWILLFILSRIILLIFPSSDLAGLISLHFGLFSKFSLWSLREMKAWLCAIHSILSSIFKVLAMRGRCHHGFMLQILCLFLWRHLENISALLLRRCFLWAFIIHSFSSRQRLHRFAPLL